MRLSIFVRLNHIILAHICTLTCLLAPTNLKSDIQGVLTVPASLNLRAKWCFRQNAIIHTDEF